MEFMIRVSNVDVLSVLKLSISLLFVGFIERYQYSGTNDEDTAVMITPTVYLPRALKELTESEGSKNGSRTLYAAEKVDVPDFYCHDESFLTKKWERIIRSHLV